jgi:hypothetical protein
LPRSLIGPPTEHLRRHHHRVVLVPVAAARFEPPPDLRVVPEQRALGVEQGAH